MTDILFDLTPHEKFLLFTGLMIQMAQNLPEFSKDQLKEMNQLAAESKKNTGQNIDKDKSAEVVMSLARRLAK